MDQRCSELCREIFLPEDHRIAELSVSTAGLFPDQTFLGRCLVTLREHYTELFQLTPAMRVAFLEDVTRVAEAVSRAFNPIKMNYAILGNLVPHLHWHLIPRSREDGLYPRPIWAAESPPIVLASGERDAVIDTIRRHLR